MQPTGNMPPLKPGTTFKRGPDPQPKGLMVTPVVHIPNLGGSVIVQTGDARRDGPHAPKPGP